MPDRKMWKWSSSSQALKSMCLKNEKACATSGDVDEFDDAEKGKEEMESQVQEKP
jgi:hypothetical protein